MIRETSCMKCSHLVFKMLKTMFDTHKDTTNNKHLVYFQKKKIFKKIDVLKFQNHFEPLL